MDPQLLDFIKETTPPLNRDIAMGIAYRHMTEAEHYVDALWNAVKRQFPAGLEYHGASRCSPEEEFNFLARRQPRRGRKKPGVKQSQREYNIARTDTYLMKYKFTYHDEVIETYINMPFVGPGGIMHLNGTRWLISPVLADCLIEYDMNDLFVIFTRAKVKFKRMEVSFYGDGRLVRANQPYALLHNKKPKVALTVRAKTTMFHYLLCKYGFDDTFKMYCNTEVKVMNREDYRPQEWPEDEWVECHSSTVNRPRSYMLPDYIPTRLVVLVPRSAYEGEKSDRLKSMLASFFYLADHFPRRIQPDYIKSSRLWRTLLGLVLWGESAREADQHDQIVKHIDSLDGYVDAIVKPKFRKLGMNVTIIYDFFAHLIDNIAKIILENRSNINSMYGKEFSVLYYMFYLLMKQINDFHFRIIAASENNLTAKDVRLYLKKIVRPGFIHNTAKEVGIFSNASSPNGNMGLRLTAIMVPQSASSKMHKTDSRNVDHRKLLHASGIEVGGFCNMPKSQPNAHARSNPRVQTDAQGGVIRREEFRELLDFTQTKFVTVADNTRTQIGDEEDDES